MAFCCFFTHRHTRRTRLSYTCCSFFLKHSILSICCVYVFACLSSNLCCIYTLMLIYASVFSTHLLCISCCFVCCLQHICAVNVCLICTYLLCAWVLHTLAVHCCCIWCFTAVHTLVVSAIYTHLPFYCCYAVYLLYALPCCVAVLFVHTLAYIYIHICCAHLVYSGFALLICMYDMHMYCDYALGLLFCFCFCGWLLHQLHCTSCAAPAAAHLQHLCVSAAAVII